MPHFRPLLWYNCDLNGLDMGMLHQCLPLKCVLITAVNAKWPQYHHFCNQTDGSWTMGAFEKPNGKKKLNKQTVSIYKLFSQTCLKGQFKRATYLLIHQVWSNLLCQKSGSMLSWTSVCLMYCPPLNTMVVSKLSCSCLFLSPCSLIENFLRPCCFPQAWYCVVFCEAKDPVRQWLYSD